MGHILECQYPESLGTEISIFWLFLLIANDRYVYYSIVRGQLAWSLV